jgi:TolA-binding protein
MIATISKSFVFLKANADVDTSLARRYGIAGFPTMVITHPNGMEYDRLVGYYPPMDFIPALFDLMMNRNTLSYLLTKSVEYPDSLQLLNDIGEAYEYKSEFPQAAFYYTQVLEKDKDDSLGMASGAWMALAGIQRRDGKDEEAVKMYLDLANKFPNSDKKDDAYMAAAGVYRREGDVKKAVKMYEEFQKKFPDSDLIDDSRVLIPYTYQHNDQPDKALKLYKQYLEKYPDTDNSEWVQKQINSIEEEKNKEK